MAAVGGDIIEVTFNSPDGNVGSGVFFAKAAEDSTFNLGGFRNSDDDNMIDGSGKAIYQKNRSRWSFEFITSWDMNTAEEMEKLVALSNSNLEATFTIAHTNGTIYQGTGTVVGDLKGNGNTAQIPVKLSGGGILQQI